MPKTVHISGVPFGARLGRRAPFPVTATTSMVLMSELTVLTAACATAFAVVAPVWYAVTCTDRMEITSAAPVEVLSAVGYAVATPEPTVITGPNQLPTTTEESGAPAAAAENELDPLWNKGLFCRLK